MQVQVRWLVSTAGEQSLLMLPTPTTARMPLFTRAHTPAPHLAGAQQAPAALLLQPPAGRMRLLPTVIDAAASHCVSRSWTKRLHEPSWHKAAEQPAGRPAAIEAGLLLLQQPGRTAAKQLVHPCQLVELERAHCRRQPLLLLECRKRRRRAVWCERAVLQPVLLLHVRCVRALVSLPRRRVGGHQLSLPDVPREWAGHGVGLLVAAAVAVLRRRTNRAAAQQPQAGCCPLRPAASAAAEAAGRADAAWHSLHTVREPPVQRTNMGKGSADQVSAVRHTPSGETPPAGRAPHAHTCASPSRLCASCSGANSRSSFSALKPSNKSRASGRISGLPWTASGARRQAECGPRCSSDIRQLVRSGGAASRAVAAGRHAHAVTLSFTHTHTHTHGADPHLAPHQHS
jgi:hypothetical protein